MLRDYYERLKIIQHTCLLFEDRSELYRFLGIRDPRNCPSRRSRSSRRVREDYKRLAALACSKGVPDEGQMDSLLGLYKEASEDGAFYTTSNSRFEKGRGIFDKLTDEGLQDLILDFLLGKHEGNRERYRALELTEGDDASIINNYCLTLGILLIIGSIPFYNSKSRPGRSKRNLRTDTERAISFLSGLRDKVGVQMLDFEHNLEAMKRRSLSRTWNRLGLILAVKQQIDYLAIGVRPPLMKEYLLPDSERVVKKLPFEDGYWVSKRPDGEETTYRLQSTDGIHHLYRFDREWGRWMRWSMTFYRDLRVIIENIDSEYEMVIKGSADDRSSTASYEFDWDEDTEQITIYGADREVFGIEKDILTKVRDDEVDGKIRRHTYIEGHMKGAESIHIVASLSMISINSIVLQGVDGTLFQVVSTPENNLHNILGDLTIDDNVHIAESGGRRSLVIDPKSARLRSSQATHARAYLDISTPDLMKKYGVSVMRGR